MPAYQVFKCYSKSPHFECERCLVKILGVNFFAFYLSEESLPVNFLLHSLFFHRLFRLRTRDWKRSHVSQWLLYFASKQSALERTLKLPPLLNVLYF